MQGKYRLLLHNVTQLVQVSDSKQPYKRMQDCTDLAIKNDYSVVVDAEGKIAKIGPASQISSEFEKDSFEEVIDCSKFCVMPGFVDAHTHAVFYGDRSKEYDMKLNGMGYYEIYNEGLGIRYTTNSVANSTVEELAAHLDRYLPRMSKLGTTTVEIKSGYGLDAEN